MTLAFNKSFARRLRPALSVVLVALPATQPAAVAEAFSFSHVAKTTSLVNRLHGYHSTTKLFSTRKSPVRTGNSSLGVSSQETAEIIDAMDPEHPKFAEELPMISAQQEASLQSIPTIWEKIRSIDRDTIINITIFIVAVAAIATQVLSVNSGITRGWTADEIAYRVPIDNWQSYTEILNAAPLQTKAITSATVYTVGDVISQRTEGVEIGKLDRPRILRSLIAGLIGHGPMSHIWYDVSEDVFENVLHLTAWWSFVPKVVIDQALWGPFWNNSYILLLGIMQFQKPSQIWADVKRTTIPLIISGLKLWPLAHCVTYGLVPVENRLLWVDVVEIVWVVILANQASGGGHNQAVPDDEPTETSSEPQTKSAGAI